MSSPACCKLAPVTADYTPKGKYEKIAGINTCKMSHLPHHSLK